MSGKSKVRLSDKAAIKNEYACDHTFYRAPKEFKAFAKELRDKNVSSVS